MPVSFRERKTDDNDYVYVVCKTRGWIPELKGYGPFKSFVSKDMLKTLIAQDYDIELANPKAYPEFAAQLDEYRAELARKDREKGVPIQTSIFEESPYSLVSQLERQAQNPATSIDRRNSSIAEIARGRGDIGQMLMAKIDDKQSSNRDGGLNLYEDQLNLINNLGQEFL